MPPLILQVELPFGNPAYIAVAYSGEPTTEELTIVAAFIIMEPPEAPPLPDYIIRHAADIILTDPATNRPCMQTKRGAETG